jgi:hypothetical protein
MSEKEITGIANWDGVNSHFYHGCCEKCKRSRFWIGNLQKSVRCACLCEKTEQGVAYITADHGTLSARCIMPVSGMIVDVLMKNIKYDYDYVAM